MPATSHDTGGLAPPATVRLLDVDPDLGRYLNGDDPAAVRRHAIGSLGRLGTGSWQPSLDGHGGPAAFLVLDGLLLREVSVGRASTVELLGAGDVVLSIADEGSAGFLDTTVSWRAVEPTRVVWLGRAFAQAARRWPGLWMAVCERVEARAHRGSLVRAVGHLVRVDHRVQALLWLLSERWGRVTPEGVVVEAKLTHRLLGDLIGARRPSVTTALNRLEAEGALVRRADGGWLLLGGPPEVTAVDEPGAWEPLSSAS